MFYTAVLITVMKVKARRLH